MKFAVSADVCKRLPMSADKKQSSCCLRKLSADSREKPLCGLESAVCVCLRSKNHEQMDMGVRLRCLRMSDGCSRCRLHNVCGDSDENAFRLTFLFTVVLSRSHFCHQIEIPRCSFPFASYSLILPTWKRFRRSKRVLDGHGPLRL